MKLIVFDKFIFNGFFELKQDRLFQVVDQSLFEYVDSVFSLNIYFMYIIGMFRFVNFEFYQNKFYYFFKIFIFLSIYIVFGGFVFIDCKYINLL